MAVYRPTYKDPKTGARKRSDVWWFNFTFAGRRIQESSKSARKTVAVEAEKNRRRELEQVHAGIPTDKPADRIRSVAAALKEYQKRYAVNHRPKSVAWVKERSVNVERLIGSALIPDLTESKITAYMSDRLKEGAGHRTVNMEIECLGRAVGHPWRVLWPKLKRLEEPKDTGRALSREEEGKLLESAAKSRSPLVLPFLRIALLTGMRFGEIRNLKWSRIDLAARALVIGKAKTAAGSGRVIPMSQDLHATFAGHAAWLAEKLQQPLQPDWYVFPFSSGVKPVDPTKAVTTIKTAWERVRDDAGVTCRFHDLRHTAYTKLAEAGVPEETMQAKRAAVEVLSLQKPDLPTKEIAEVAKSARIN